MRKISANALAKLSTEKGIESVLVFRVKWADSGQWIHYSDREFWEPVRIIGKILSFGNLDNVSKISGSGQSQSISVVMDDTDGSLKRIIDSHDIHKRPVVVNQWFTGIPYADSFILFKGFISSPIVWKESERTLSFDVISRLEDNEVGFSAEEGQFPIVPHNLVGQAWPLGFGTNIQVPTLKLNETPIGTSVDQIAFPDPDLLNKIGDNERASGNTSQAAQINAVTASKATRWAVVIRYDIEQVEAAIAAIKANPEFEPNLNMGEGPAFESYSFKDTYAIMPYTMKMPEGSLDSPTTPAPTLDDIPAVPGV